MSRGRGAVTRSRAAWLAGAALLVAVLLAFGQVGSFGFVDYDDREYVLENPHLREGSVADRAAWAFTTFHAANWHPLTWLSFAADASLFDLAPGALHRENLALHAANALLAFALLRRLTGALAASALAAALFALHPQRAESAAWVTERKGLLMALFSLLALHAHVWFARRPGPLRAAAVWACGAAAMLAKPQAVALPLLLLVVDWWPLARLGGGAARPVTAARAVLEKAPLLLAAAGVSAATLVAQQRAGAVAPLDAVGALERLGNAAAAVPWYLGKTAWPAGLSPVYPLAPVPASLAGAGALLLAAALALAWRRRRASPWVAAALLGCVALLAPVSGLVQAGGQAVADRYTYVPHLLLFTGIAWSGAALTAGRPRLRAAAAALAAVGLAAFGAAAHRQAAVWRDDERLFSHAAAAVPGNWKMHYNLANTIERRGGPQEDAERNYRLALEARPDYPEALNNLGALLGRRGDHDAARALFGRAVAAAPAYGPGWFNLGRERELAGDDAGALEAYGRSAALQPTAAEPRARMGLALRRLGWGEPARAACAEALRLDPASRSAAACLAGEDR